MEVTSSKSIPHYYNPRSTKQHGSPAFVVCFFSLWLFVMQIDVVAAADSKGLSTATVPRFLRATTSSSSAALERRMQAVSDPSCTVDCCQQFESSICPGSDNAWIDSIPLWIQILLVVILITASSLFAGLTLGLLGLDKTGLEIIMEGDDPKRAEEARRVYSIRQNANLLLCTLILGNVAVNALLSILMGAYFGGIVGFIGSTLLIVIFGEIIPQSLCARYALQIGSKTVPLVRILLVLFYPFAFPPAYVLNKLMGNELPTTYSSSEMRKLLEIHVAEGRFDAETADAMTGALQYKEMSVKQVMTSIENTFMLHVDEKLNFETIAIIFKTGYSRIPVYEVSRNNVIGLLFVKDLIFVDPEDETSVRRFVQIFGRGVHVVWPDDKLGDVLRELKKGKSHMALVRDVNNEDSEQDPFYEIKGIITLEDIIEEIIGDEIVDETDAFVDGSHSVKVNRLENFDWGRLRLLDSKIVDQRLSHDEVKAITAHLRTNYTESFTLLTDHQLQRFVTETHVEDLPCSTLEVGQQVPDQVLYERGVTTDTCTLILSGKVTVLAGADKFRSDVSSWSLLGAGALTQASYVPDFTAFVSSGPCRCIRMTLERFNEAADASAVERTAHVLPAATVVIPPAAAAADDTLSLPTMLEQVTNPRKELKSRRSKIIAALQRIEHPDVIAEEADENNDDRETSRARSGVGYASDGAWNSVLTDGGTYQHKKVGLSSTSPSLASASSGKSPDNNIEYLGPNE